MPALEFPAGFVWGTATAAHQVEGGNWNNDWWMWEHDPASPCVDVSGDACDHFHRYPEDIAALAALGFNAYRFSIEWSRIEPEEGEFSRAALDHYRSVCTTCIDNGLTPIVTFHHFTTPRWVATNGGWEASETADRFARYCETATGRLGDLIGWACTINEPNIVSVAGYLAGTFPPGRTDRDVRRTVNEVFREAHRKGYEAIKSGPGDFPVGLTLAMSDYQAVDGGESKRDQIRRGMEDEFLESVRGDDFLGVQTYSRTRIGPDGAFRPEEGVPVVQMGYEFWPDSLEATIRRAYEITDGVPIVVTENGIGTDDDDQRVDYVTQALQGVRRCLDDGIDLRGYVYWTLLDNFEWAEGYRPTFGLFTVDRESFERTPKPSAAWLGEIARTNTLTL
jgi:beta-glucosidase